MTDAARSAGGVCVTGTSGYLGSRIASALEARGVAVHRMSRATGFQLGAPIGPESFAALGARALIHCAHDFSPRTWDEMERVNVAGSLRLFDAARAGGVARIVFVSSLAAYEGVKSLYGRAKRTVEIAVAKDGGESIRPGVIWGPRPGGMMQSLAEKVRGAGAMMPVVRHPAPLYMAHEDDVARLAGDLCDASGPASRAPWFAAAARPWSLTEIVRAIARHEGRAVRLVGVPWRPAWMALRTMEAVGMKPAFRSDSLLSLGHPAPPADTASLARPPFEFRAYA